MSTFDLSNIGWSEPRVVQTRVGPRRIRTWRIPKDSGFWNLWKTGNLKQRGYSLSKWQGEWQVTEWRDADGAQTEQARRAEAAVVELDREENIAENTDVVLPMILQARFEEVERIYDEIEEETGNDYRYQLPSIKRLALAVEANNGALDASDTGTGKTPVACGVAKTLGMDLFVVCPKSVIPPWRRMAKRFGVAITIINYEMLRTGNTEFGWAEKAGARKTFGFYEEEVDPESTLIVFDECHRMKDSQTWNCAMGVAALNEGYKVVALSATAADNPMHMKFVGLLTGLFQHPNHFYGWMTQNGVRKGKWGLEFVGGKDVLRRIHRQIFPARGSRIRIADLGDRFPATQIVAEAYEMNGATEEIQAIYEEMEKEIAKLEESKAEDKGANILTEILRARQQVELLKVPTLVQMAQDGLDEGMAVVLVVNFEASVRALAQRLKTNATITGSDDVAERQRLIDAFNADDEQLVIMNIKAGGLGISLHGSSGGRPRLVLISPTYSGIDLKQALGRCHRAGGARSLQRIIFAAGTVEETACDRVRRKIDRVAIINDGELDQALNLRP